MVGLSQNSMHITAGESSYISGSHSTVLIGLNYVCPSIGYWLRHPHSGNTIMMLFKCILEERLAFSCDANFRIATLRWAVPSGRPSPWTSLMTTPVCENMYFWSVINRLHWQGKTELWLRYRLDSHFSMKSTMIDAHWGRLEKKERKAWTVHSERRLACYP